MNPDSPSLCILCSTPLTDETNSEEHIVADAIGGRKTVRTLICKDCNSRTGTDWDAEVSRQMEQMSLLFGVRRSRGDLRPSVLTTSSGKEVLYRHDGTMTPRHPTYSETPHEGGVNIQVSARSMTEARKMLKRIARKYPKLDVEAAIAQATRESVAMGEPLTFSAPRGGVPFWRSAVKSMLAVMRLVSADAMACEHAVAFLLDSDQEPCVGYYYERDLVKDRPEGVPFHVVHVEGQGGVIIGYIEYFGFFRAVSLLSSSYDGMPFQATYAVDPRSGTELPINVELRLTKDEIREAYEWKRYNPENLRRAMEAVIGPAVRATNEAPMSRIIDEAIARTMDECGIDKEPEATEEQFRCFSSKVASLVVGELVNRGLIRERCRHSDGA